MNILSIYVGLHLTFSLFPFLLPLQDLGGDNAAVRAQQEVKSLKKLCEYLQALRQLKQEGELNGEEEQSLENGDASEEGMDAADAYDDHSPLLPHLPSYHLSSLVLIYIFQN